jgi:DNA-directed RNA polymerase subunit M/transcription elongation factor TFIIS
MKRKYINTDVVFRCRKCEHLLFVDNISIERLSEISKMDCPKCGEDGYENWILSRTGNYDEEFGV